MDEAKEVATVESVARDMGWADQEEWKGDPDQWRPAEDFIRAAQSISQDKGSEILDLKSKIDGLTGELRSMGVNQAQQIKAATDAARDRLQRERSQAVEEGDAEKFHVVDQQLRSIPEQPDPEVARRHQDFQSGLTKFMEHNSWYQTDLAMQTYANTVGQNLANANPQIDPEAYYDTVEELVRTQFPTKFANNKPQPAAVSPDRPAAGKGNSAWSQLKAQYPEAEEAFNDLVKREIFTNKDREKYAKDVLEI